MTRKELIDYCSQDTAPERRADVEWIKATPGTVRHLWATCPRVDFLLWLAQHSPDFDPNSYNERVSKLDRRYNKKLANAIRRGVSWSAVEDALRYFYTP